MLQQLSAADAIKIKNIKRRVLAGLQVPSADKQWVLDALARIQAPVRADVLARAAAAGFNVADCVAA